MYILIFLDVKVFLVLNLTQDEIMVNWSDETTAVSICCMTYNQVDYLKDAIDSFLKQKTDFPFEIIVHDDASTDGSADLLLDYQKKYPNIIKLILQKKNIYQAGGKPFNEIFSVSKGQFLALCEGDDYWRDEYKLQKQYEFMRNKPKTAITYHKSIIVEDFIETDRFALEEKSYRNYSSDELLKGKGAISTQTVMISNKILPLPEEYFYVTNEDSFLFLLAGLIGDGEFIDSIKPSAYRVHNGGVWSKRGYHYRDSKTLVSYYWFSVFFERLSMDFNSLYFRLKVVKLALNIKRIGVMKIIKTLFTRLLK